MLDTALAVWIALSALAFAASQLAAATGASEWSVELGHAARYVYAGVIAVCLTSVALRALRRVRTHG